MTSDAPATSAPSSFTELWFTDRYREVTVWWKDEKGIMPGGADDAPESVLEDAPTGWSVWDGQRRILSEEDMAGEDGDLYREQHCRAGDEWWTGRLRPATGEEVAEFFGLEFSQPVDEGLVQRLYAPDTGSSVHGPDCAARSRRSLPGS